MGAGTDLSEYLKNAVEPEQLARRIAATSLIQLHAAHASTDPGWTERVERAFKEVTGLEWHDGLTKGPSPAYYAQGAPGEGKTTAFKIACKLMGSALNLTVLWDPPTDQLAEVSSLENALVFISENLAGQSSLIDVGGIPDVDSITIAGDSVKAQVKRCRHSFHVAARAKVAMVLFDDISNAYPAVQDTMLSIAEERKFQDLKISSSTVLGYTGNLGAADGTNAMKTSGALRTRVRMFAVQDNPIAWADRVSAMFAKTDLGDGGLSGFMRSHGAEVFRVPPPKTGPDSTRPYPCPRTWSKLIPEARFFTHQMKQHQETGRPGFWEMLGYDDPFKYLLDSASAIVGPAAAQRYSDYVMVAMLTAEPIAEELIRERKLSPESAALLDQNLGNARNSREVDFANQFLLAVGAKISTLVLASSQPIRTLRELAPAFGSACYELGRMPSGSVALAVTDLGTRLQANPLFCDDRASDVLSADATDTIVHALKTSAKQAGTILDVSALTALQEALTGVIDADAYRVSA